MNSKYSYHQKGVSVPYGTTNRPEGGLSVCHKMIGCCCDVKGGGGAMKLDSAIIGKSPTPRRNEFNASVRFEFSACSATGFCSPKIVKY